jgi:CPA2 family monovalent cation:H+ antiporter-2
MLLTLGRTALIGSGLIAGLWFVFQKLVPRLLESAPMRNNQELPLLVAIVSGLGSGVAAHAAGISPALGAFVAGMLLAESPFADQARSDVSSLKVVMLALFFSAIGMLADPIWIASNLTLVLVTVASVMLVKAAVVWGAMRAFGVGSTTALATGMSLAQTGEFSFVLADVARGGLLGHDLFMLVVSTTVITMLLTPTLVARAPRLAGQLVGRSAQAA